MQRTTACSSSSFSVRRGSTYIVVLGVSMIVAALAYGALLVTRAKGRTTSELRDAAEARQIARDAVELAKVWIYQDANWRTTRPNGVWVTNMPVGGGFFTLEAADPTDANIANLPHDPLVLKVTASKGNARHILQVTLQANPTPVSVLQYAVHTSGEYFVPSGVTQDVGGATVSTNGQLRNDGTIQGNIDVAGATTLGNVTGTKVIGSPAKPVPSSTVIDKYIALGTQINPGSAMNNVVLGPGYNPYGAPNPLGIYVVRPSGDLTIKTSRIYGTLIVVCQPSRRVNLDNFILMQPCRGDMPALLIQGEAKIEFESGLSVLRETLLLTNFNPPGAPYAGNSDSDILDTYPSEIQGLVHVTGKVHLKDSSVIKGAIISNCTDTSEAFRVDVTPVVTYMPSLFLNPPCWYTTRVDMPIQRGTWRQLAN
jgi:hypothetical protein